jgi:superfamily II DNA or RNA helicase
MGAPYFSTAIPPFHGRRWGLSATPNRADDFDSLLKYTVGHVVYKYLTPELRPKVYFKRLPTPKLDLTSKKIAKEVCASNNKFHYAKAFGYLSTLSDRTKRIVDDINQALAAGRQVLVLSHSRPMVEELGKHFPNGGVTHGGVKAKKHWEVVQNCNPVIAIMKRGKQALDKPSLDTVFICDPFSKPGVLQQTMGRVLRPHADKKPPIIVFFEDRNIPELSALCGKIRRSLHRWPADRGGRIPFKIV